MPRRPAYQQIADDLRMQVLDGTLQEGDQLPSETELMADYSVSRIVARDAVAILVNEGLIEKRHGRGSFVRPQAPRQKRIVGDFYGKRPTGSPFAASARASGQVPELEYQSRETTATKAVAERLRIEPGAPVMRTNYTFFGDGQPVMISTSYEPLELTRGTLIQQPEAGPVSGVIPRMDLIGKRITDVVEDVTARSPRPHEGTALDVRTGTPVMAIQRTYYAGEDAVETADIVVAADRYVLSYRIPLPAPAEPAEDH